MTPEQLFSLAGGLVLPVWLLLLFAPRWVWSQRLATFAAPLLLALLYAWLLRAGPPPPGSGFRTLEEVRMLFSSDSALLAGWVHYLALDLFTGAWEARDALRLRLSPWLVAPCLVLTFLFGPLGLAFYLLLRLGLRRAVDAD